MTILTESTKYIPDLTHYQVLVLQYIATEQISGGKLRHQLEQVGHKKSGPAFYQMMARLEDAGFVEGEYKQRIIDSQIFKERFYKRTGKGRKALAATLHFYRERAEIGLGSIEEPCPA